MKRFDFCRILIVTLALATASVAQADTKNRNAGLNGNRNFSGGQGSSSGNSLRSRIGQTNSSALSAKGAGNAAALIGNATNNSASSTFRKPKLELPSGNTIPGNILNHNNISGNSGNREQHNRKPDFKLTLPNNLQHQIGNSGHKTIKLPTVNLANGQKVKPIAIDVAQILKHKVPSGQGGAQPQIQNILAKAPKHLCVHPHFNWWVTLCHHHCHTHYGCWNVDYSYWNTWTPCHWHVVHCQQLSYYVGLTCIHIPDMQAYGVQSVVPGSPAHLGGLQTGDLIVSVNGQTVLDPNLINLEVPRGRLDLVVIREGAVEPVSLVVIPRLVQTVSY